jgi:PAS domain-containing protein
VPAIKRARQQADVRRAHRLANQALSDSEERFRQLAENIGAVFFMFERPNGGPGAIYYVSPAYERVWGFPCESL